MLVQQLECVSKPFCRGNAEDDLRHSFFSTFPYFHIEKISETLEKVFKPGLASGKGSMIPFEATREGQVQRSTSTSPSRRSDTSLIQPFLQELLTNI